MFSMIKKANLAQWSCTRLGPARARAARYVRGITATNTPCRSRDFLLENYCHSAKCAVQGDLILNSPTCSSFNQFRDPQARDAVRTSSPRTLAPTTSSGILENYHYRQMVSNTEQDRSVRDGNNLRFASGFFAGKPRRKITSQLIPQNKKTPSGAENP